MKPLIKPITPHLWFDKEAKEAVEFYTTLFPQSEVVSVKTITDTPSGDCDIVAFKLWDYSLMSISAGPLFKFTPAVSISVQCENEEQIDKIYHALREGGDDLMPLDVYPWSKKYAWVKDKYGLTWQLNLPNDQGVIKQRINPALMYVGDVCGKAEEAINYYVSVFPNSKINSIFRYEKGQEPDKEGTVAHAEFELGGKLIMALDSAREHKFNFNEAVSLMIYCETQEEIDYYWEKLSAVPESEQCGWLKDKYGLSWQ